MVFLVTIGAAGEIEESRNLFKQVPCLRSRKNQIERFVLRRVNLHMPHIYDIEYSPRHMYKVYIFILGGRVQ